MVDLGEGHKRGTSAPPPPNPAKRGKKKRGERTHSIRAVIEYLCWLTCTLINFMLCNQAITNQPNKEINKQFCY